MVPQSLIGGGELEGASLKGLGVACPAKTPYRARRTLACNGVLITTFLIKGLNLVIDTEYYLRPNK